jgi:hypothetical protein
VAGSARVALLALLFSFACNSNSKKGPVGGTYSCKTSADCPVGLPMCTPDSKICVGCLPNCQTTCGANLTCDATTFQCVPVVGTPMCHCSFECPRPGIDPSTYIACEVDAGTCVGCLANTDCVMPNVCITATHTCGDPCSLCTPQQTCDRTKQICVDPPDMG